jgi:hypothetical protein
MLGAPRPSASPSASARRRLPARRPPQHALGALRAPVRGRGRTRRQRSRGDEERERHGPVAVAVGAVRHGRRGWDASSASWSKPEELREELDNRCEPEAERARAGRREARSARASSRGFHGSRQVP